VGEVIETAKIRVTVQPPDADNAGYHVHLPTYVMVPGSWLPVVQGRIDKDGVRLFDDDKKPVVLTPAETAQLTCEVLVPDEFCDDKGQLDQAKIRSKYKGQPRWDRDNVLEGVL